MEEEEKWLANKKSLELLRRLFDALLNQFVPLMKEEAKADDENVGNNTKEDGEDNSDDDGENNHKKEAEDVEGKESHEATTDDKNDDKHNKEIRISEEEQMLLLKKLKLVLNTYIFIAFGSSCDRTRSIAKTDILRFFSDYLTKFELTTWSQIFDNTFESIDAWVIDREKVHSKLQNKKDSMQFRKLENSLEQKKKSLKLWNFAKFLFPSSPTISIFCLRSYLCSWNF